jgi:peptide/nickel transport system substrate-binding protein
LTTSSPSIRLRFFEFSGAEYAANTYDRMITFDVDNVSDISGGIAESWEISDDGMVYTFKVREGIQFASRQPGYRR